jgi:hypothetical protein
MKYRFGIVMLMETEYTCGYLTEACEKCSLPVNQEAFEKMKKQQESRMNTIVDERLKAKDVEIQGLKEQVEEVQDLYQSLTKTLDEVADLRAKRGCLGLLQNTV